MVEPAWTTNWVWALPIIALTLTVHAAAVVLIAVLLVRIRRNLRSKSWPLQRAILLSTAVIGAVGGILALLHGVEAGLWAALFLWLGALTSPADAMLYSLDSLTTRGESGLILEHNWRLMGALEAADGVLLFGISTAFLFTVIAGVSAMLTKIAHTRPRRSS